MMPSRYIPASLIMSSSGATPVLESKALIPKSNHRHKANAQKKPDSAPQSDAVSRDANAELLRFTKMTVEALADKIASCEAARAALEARVTAAENDRVNLLNQIESERSARYAVINTLYDERQAAKTTDSPAVVDLVGEDLVRVGEYTPDHIVLEVGLVPGARFLWSCSVEDIDPEDINIEDAGRPWHEIVAHEFDKSQECVFMGHLSPPSAVIAHIDVRFAPHRASAPSTLVSVHCGEFDDGSPHYGYNVVVTNARLAKILGKIASAIRRTYAK